LVSWRRDIDGLNGPILLQKSPQGFCEIGIGKNRIGTAEYLNQSCASVPHNIGPEATLLAIRSTGYRAADQCRRGDHGFGNKSSVSSFSRANWNWPCVVNRVSVASIIAERKRSSNLSVISSTDLAISSPMNDPFTLGLLGPPGLEFSAQHPFFKTGPTARRLKCDVVQRRLVDPVTRGSLIINNMCGRRKYG